MWDDSSITGGEICHIEILDSASGLADWGGGFHVEEVGPESVLQL